MLAKKEMEENPLLFPIQMCPQPCRGCALPKATLSLSFAKLVGRKTGIDAAAAQYIKPLSLVFN